MIKFIKPVNLNGAELIEEFKSAGIELPYFEVDGNNDLWIDISEKHKTIATDIVAKHNGTIKAPEPSIFEKLASVGLDVNDLKKALGLA